MKYMSASITQGSAIGQHNGSDLCPVTSGNHLCKHATDTYTLILAINVSTRHAELVSPAHWAQANNLTHNIAKSQKYYFQIKGEKKNKSPNPLK